MAKITAAMVKELRETTGAGMMDCKKALTATDGDKEKAIDWLREKGISKAEKKAGRIAAEGAVAAYISDDAKSAFSSKSTARRTSLLAMSSSVPSKRRLQNTSLLRTRLTRCPQRKRDRRQDGCCSRNGSNGYDRREDLPAPFRPL